MRRILSLLVCLLLASVQTLLAWSGVGTPDDPYQIATTADWQELASQVAAGESFSGKTFRLTADVDADGTSVGTDDHPFAGIFDGWNFTLTYNKGAAANYAAERCAPFRFVSGATIRHLKTTGMIYSSEQYAGGIVSMVNGSSVTTLTDCHSDIRLYTPSPTLGGVLKNAAHGGLVGAVNTGGLIIDRCTFEGEFDGENSAGMVGWSNVDITIRNSVVDFSNPIYVNGGRTFARMDGGATLTITDSYFTLAVERFDEGTTTELQGECVFNTINMPEGCSYEFESEPTVNLNGESYWKSGARVRLTVPDDIAFDHWDTKNNGCYINDPWTRDGIHVISDVRLKPTFSIATEMPEAKTSHTFYGVEYRYLSRSDYHLYLSNETCRAKSWTFDDDNYLVGYDSDGDKLFITAVVGHTGNISTKIDDSFTGTILQNDNVTGTNDRTHLAVIAPRAFKGCSELTSLAFQSDEGHPFYTVAHQPDFIIGEEAFADCPNLQKFIMMYYDRTGTDSWEAIPPSWVASIAPDAFRGSDNCEIFVDHTVYQQYLNDENWSALWNLISPYSITVEDMNVNGASYSYMRNNQTTKPLKNDATGHETMMQMIRGWNAEFQNFTASSLLAEQDKKNIWYTQVTGVHNSSLDSDGTMRIYNDPGSYYNYKTIAIDKNAFQNNESLKAIEFWQTNGRSENSYTDLKMVIRNGAFKGCKNLKELRMFYYVQDGDDHWETLGPQDVIPGSNIFGEPQFDEETTPITDELVEAIATAVPEDFKILVASERMNEFLSDPNWAPYAAYITAVEYGIDDSDDFTKDGLTYSYMTNPGGIRQTSQTVSQDVSWWTVPRIGIEVIETLLTLRSVYSSYKSFAALKEALDELGDLAKGQQYSKFSSSFGSLMRRFLGQEPASSTILIRNNLQSLEGMTYEQLGLSLSYMNKSYGPYKMLLDNGFINKYGLVALGTVDKMSNQQLKSVAHCFMIYGPDLGKEVATKMPAVQQAVIKYAREFAGNGVLTELLASGPVGMSAITGLYASGQLNEYCNGEYLQKGMRQNILSNIHQVGSVGGGYVFTTPQKNLVYHTYIKNVSDDVTDAVIYAGTDKGQGKNASARTMAMKKSAFQNKTNLQTVSFFENNVSTNEAIPMLLTIPDSAFVGCTNLRELNLLLKTDGKGTYALGPESFILAGDSIFAGLDSLQFHIRIDESRKQDFLDSESWKPYRKYFVYDNAAPAEDYNEYGGKYAYAYENGSVQKVHKVSGHKIEHMIVTGATTKSGSYLLSEHQGALKLCNDIGEWNNFQLDAVSYKAFYGNKDLRVVNFTDLYGQGAFGDSYTGLEMTLEDSCFAKCPNLANIDMLYLVTDGDNHIDPITPQQVKIGKGVFAGSTNAVIKMLPEQVALFEADSAWAAYKKLFRPCIIHEGDEGVMAALEPMAYYDMAATGYDPSYWKEYIDLMRIAGAGFSWLDGRFPAEKDDLRTFGNFKYFESVGLDYVGKNWFDGCYRLSNITLPSTIKNIQEYAFKNCTALAEIELPASVEDIATDAFLGCTALKTIVVRGDEPATVHSQAIPKNEGLKIYVPKGKVNTYKSRWIDYADYIVGIDEMPVTKHVVTTKVGELAEKLGLTAESASIYMAQQLRYLGGNYAKYDSLTISGPLNNLDLAVLRYMAGCDAYTNNGKPTDGQLRYLNLYNASLLKDQDNFYCEVGGSNYRTNYDNWIPTYAFYKCNKLETIILPKTTVHISDHAFDDATSLKRVAVCSNATISSSNVVGSSYHVLNAPLAELVFYSDEVATSSANEPWGQTIEQVYTLRSQLGDYLGDAGLMNSAQSVMAPFEDDAAVHALAKKSYYFPDEYFAMKNVENIFNQQLDQPLTRLDDFWQFGNVKMLESTFNGCADLKTITLPDSIESISAEAFAGCSKLDTIRVSCDSVPLLAADAFKDLPQDFRILVPSNRCKLYRDTWTQYADHINADNSFYSDDDLITIELTEPNTLAEKLGLKVTTDFKSSVMGWDYYYVTSIRGDYSNVHKLKIIGPISGQDISVLRYLSGFCPWTNSRSTFAPLEYIDLYDAQLKASDFAVASDMFWKTTRVVKIGTDNVLPAYSFLQCYNLKTLILPKTCTLVRDRALQQCEALETLVVGDDCTEFNWDALDDDASLERMYILSKNKLDISTEFAVWRWLCNNYNPTFDAFYVRPSLYDQYLHDNAYTGSSWQRTNNISKGVFEDDENFIPFASHAAATQDELSRVTNVDGWFNNYTAIKDLTPLGYTSIDSLQVSDMQALKQLQKIELPRTFQGFNDDINVEEGAELVDNRPFNEAYDLRYIDMLACESTSFINGFGGQVLEKLGVNTNEYTKALVYMPSIYGETNEHNVVWGDAGNLQNNYFDINDTKDYFVPMAFKSQNIGNLRVLYPNPSLGTAKYTVCLPYELNVPAGAKAFKLNSRNGSKLIFTEEQNRMEANTPYLLVLTTDLVSLNSDVEQTIPTAVEAEIAIGRNQIDVIGASMRGTIKAIDNATAADLGAFILQSDNKWHQVPANTEAANIPAFRTYLLENGGTGVKAFTMELQEDGVDGIDTIQTIEADGTERYYDLSGREIVNGKLPRGVYIHNGKKYINK